MAGNRLKKETAEGTELYSYNARNQLLRIEKGGNATHYRYDPQGNMLEEAGGDRKEYAYDALNRLSSITSDVVTQKNHYDGELLRYETEENDKVIRFVFDQGVLSTENTIAARGNIRYIHGNNKVVCSVRQVGDSGYHIQDEVGSTLFIMDREQNIRKTYRYDAFGRVLEEKGDIENCLTYTGQMYDGATGQYYLRARFYNPSVGRFQQEDVYRGDGLNLYAYCANNPVMYYDPSGYMGLCPVVGGTGNSDIPSGYYQDSTGKWYRPNGQFASKAEMGIPETALNSPTSSHGNSLSDPRTNYGYVLVDRDTGEILKFGETLNPDTRYSQSFLNNNNATMKILESGSKAC